MNIYRQEKLVEKLLQFRWRKHNFDLIKVECYGTFSNDGHMCRVECFKGGLGYENRVMKHEAILNDTFVMEAEKRLKEILTPVN